MEGQAITHQTKRRGFNLIESAIVLGVVGAIIGGIWVAAASFYESYKVNKTVEGIFTTIKSIQDKISILDLKTICAQAGTNHASLSAAYSIALSLYPKDWVYGNRIKHPFGGESSIHLYEGTPGGSPDRFDFYLHGLSEDVCIRIVVAVSSRIAFSRTSDWSSIGYIKTPISTAITVHNFPISPETAITMCAGGQIVLLDASLTRIN